MKKVLFLLALIGSLSAFANTPNWGKTGHRATAQIASMYLSPEAKQKISKLLNGQSLALVSTFADEIKSDRDYDNYSPWHYINLPKGKSYEEVKDGLGPNIIFAIKKCREKLEDEATSQDKKRFYLKMLIHLIGDLHQPLHVGHARDQGGNLILVSWFDESSDLHKVWDSEMIDSYKMSYSELAENQQPLNQKDRDAIQEGDPVDWMKETRKITTEIYSSTETGGQLRYGYMYEWMPVIREQLQKGGLRLAGVLNDIFGE